MSFVFTIVNRNTGTGGLFKEGPKRARRLLGKVADYDLLYLHAQTQLFIYDNGEFITIEFTTSEGGWRTFRKTELKKNTGFVEKKKSCIDFFKEYIYIFETDYF